MNPILTPLHKLLKSDYIKLLLNLDHLKSEMEYYDKDDFLKMFVYLDNEESNLESLINLLSQIKKDFTYNKIMLGAKANYIMEEQNITLA